VEPSEVAARSEAELAEAKLRAFEHARRQEVAKSTDQQVHEAVESLRGIPELRPEVWRGMVDDAQRLKVLQGIEDKMARIQERPPVPVVAEQTKPGEFGGYIRAEGKIIVSLEHMRSNDIREIMDTIVHEGRHAYQDYAVTHPGFHSDQAQVEAWDWNCRHYMRAEQVGQSAYMQQPVEADAWAYANRIVRGVMGGL
jgi:hypothetical protein